MRSAIQEKIDDFENFSFQDLEKEYEEFVYIVSHDFSAPLWHVKEFTNLLINSMEDRVSDEERIYVNFIEKSIARMGRMQKSLLEFSRLHTNTKNFKSVQTTDILNEVLAEINMSDYPHEVIITHDKMPKITADHELFKILLHYVIDNACRYGYLEGVQKVNIKTVNNKEEVVFEISDNGIGIDSELCDAAFGMFWRFHNQDEYGAGIGAGLAICKKIIELHNGHIWINSKLNEGTSVLFSIPKS